MTMYGELQFRTARVLRALRSVFYQNARRSQICQIGFVGQRRVADIPDEGLSIRAVHNVARSFRPRDLFVQEFISATDPTTGGRVHGAAASAVDVFLAQSYMGGSDTFPNVVAAYVSQDSRIINCAIFNPNRFRTPMLSWHDVPSNIDMTLEFVVSPTILRLLPQCQLAAPSYTITVTAQIEGDLETIA